MSRLHEFMELYLSVIYLICFTRWLSCLYTELSLIYGTVFGYQSKCTMNLDTYLPDPTRSYVAYHSAIVVAIIRLAQRPIQHNSSSYLNQGSPVHIVVCFNEKIPLHRNVVIDYSNSSLLGIATRNPGVSHQARTPRTLEP